MEDNNELIEKLRELKDGNTQRMAKLDAIIVSSRENIRMKCLEAALKFYELKGKEPLQIANVKPHFVTNEDIINLAEDFYKFVKGDTDEIGHILAM